MSKNMVAVKRRLAEKYGERCEVCDKWFSMKKLTGHHIIMKSKGGKITEANILLACYHCHFEVINKMKYNSKEYLALMEQSLNKRKEAIV